MHFKKEKHPGSRDRLKSMDEDLFKRRELVAESDALWNKIISEKDKHSLWCIFWDMEDQRVRAWKELKEIGFSSDDAQMFYGALGEIHGSIGQEIESFFIEEATPNLLSCALQFKFEESSVSKQKCFKRLQKQFEEGFIIESHYKTILLLLLKDSLLLSSSFEELKKLNLSLEEIDEISTALRQAGKDKRLKDVENLLEKKKKSMKAVMGMREILEKIKNLREK